MSDAQPIVRKGIKLGVKRDAEDNADGIQVIKENFPKQRSLHLRPEGGEPQKGERVDIVVTEEVLLATAHHVAQDTSKESGGFLLGNRYECPNTDRQYIIIDQFMKADYTEGTQVSLTFTTDSWGQLTERMSGKYRGKQLVGWYHSHPGMGIFLSNYDLDIHKNRFANEWDVALVLDPIKHEGGFFAWVGGNVNPREKLDFYELLDGDSRETVTAWTNYKAVDPKTNTIAALKSVNTQNSDGNPMSVASASQKSQAAAASNGILGNPIMLIGGAIAIGLLLLGTVFGAYWMFFRKTGETANNSSTNSTSDKNKVLNSKNIKISDDLKGWVSSENKMTVDIDIKGIGSPEVIEEVRKDITVEINGKEAKVEKTEISNGAILKIRAVSDVSGEIADKFNSNKEQELLLRVQMSYGEDDVTKRINATFNKGRENPNPSLGSIIVFNGDKPVIDEDDAPVKKKQVVTQKPSENQDNDTKKQQPQDTVKKKENENPKPVPTKTQPKPKPTSKPGKLEQTTCKIMGTC